MTSKTNELCLKEELITYKIKTGGGSIRRTTGYQMLYGQSRAFNPILSTDYTDYLECGDLSPLLLEPSLSQSRGNPTLRRLRKFFGVLRPVPLVEPSKVESAQL
jgi:hypothetical protein